MSSSSRSFILFISLQLLTDNLTFSPLSSEWFKMISPTMSVNPVPDFFEPIRRTAIINLLGYLPILNTRGAITGVATSHGDNAFLTSLLQSDLPVVTYISRQSGGRRLSEAGHEGLVQALRDLEREGVCIVNVVRMETMSLKEQVAVAAKSTVGLLIIAFHRRDVLFSLWFTGTDWCSRKWNDGKRVSLSLSEFIYIIHPV